MAADKFTFEGFKYDGDMILKTHGVDEGGRVQQFIDTQCLQLCEPLIPKDTGALINSGIINTRIGSGEVKWSTPYARRWYYMPASFQGAPQRGNYWFDRMKAQYKGKILDGAKRLTNGK